MANKKRGRSRVNMLRENKVHSLCPADRRDEDLSDLNRIFFLNFKRFRSTNILSIIIAENIIIFIRTFEYPEE